MKIPHTRSRLTLFFFLTALVTLGQARIPTHNTKKTFQLIFTPIHSATFVFYIIFGLFALLQAFSALLKAITALRSIGRRNKPAEAGLDFSTGSIYAYIVFLAASSALAYYILSTVWVVYTLNDFELKPVTDTFLAGRTIADELSDFFICFAILALIYHRQRVGFGRNSPGLRPYTYKAIVDGLVLVAFLAVIIVYSCLRSVYSSNSSLEIVHAYYQLLTIQRTELGLFFALAVNIAVSSVWTWMKFKKGSKADAVSFFRINKMQVSDGFQAILGQVAKFVSPMLITRAIYRVVEYIFSYDKGVLSAKDQDALRLARVLVLGFTYFVILVFSIN